MKIRILSFTLFIILMVGMFTACALDKNYGNKLPPDFPSSVPIIEGTIEESKSTTFDDGKGFVVGIRTPLSYEKAIEFYKKALETSGDSAKFTEATNMSGTSEKVMAVEVYQGEVLVLMEIISGDGSSHVNIAVHLGK